LPVLTKSPDTLTVMYGLRPRMGSVTSCSSLKSVLTEAVEGSTREASALTCATSGSAPTASDKSSVRKSWVANWMCVRSVALNPVASI
jgi:hypothetical protein